MTKPQRWSSSRAGDDCVSRTDGTRNYHSMARSNRGYCDSHSGQSNSQYSASTPNWVGVAKNQIVPVYQRKIELVPPVNHNCHNSAISITSPPESPLSLDTKDYTQDEITTTVQTAPPPKKIAAMQDYKT